MKYPSRGLLAAVATIALIAGGALTASPAVASSTGVVINEVYGGGGNSGSVYTTDFVELENRGPAAVDLTGWAVQYHSGSATGTWQVTPLSGSIAAGARFVVAESQGAGGTISLPQADVSGSIAMSATAGTVAVTTSSSALSCASSAACATVAVDLVGFGTAAISEGSPALGASNTTSVQRGTGADSDVNSADFAAFAPTPGAANTTSGTGGGTPPVAGTTRIHDIQGTGFLSPLNNQTVSNVPGIVTAVRASGSSRGYWIQDPTPDADPATSEGVFVFTSAPAVAAGDSVLVSGTVKDFYTLAAGDTLATTSNLSTTEIENSTVFVLSHGNALPDPVVLDPTTVPETYAPDLGGGNIEATPITPARSALDFYESIEGMRAEVIDARVVGPSNDFGETYVTTKPDQAVSFRGGTLLTAENATPSGRLEVVALDGSDLGADVNDVLRGATVGPIDWSSFGGYLIAATHLGTRSSGGIAPVVATAQSADQLAVATYNVENLAPGDPADKYSRLAAGIVTNLASPDIVAVEEVQDDSGATDDAVVTATQTLTKLTAAIAAAGGPFYQWREIDPVNDQDGGQPGGNIRVAFLFNPARVSFVDTGAATTDRSTTATAVSSSHGSPTLSLSPGRIDPTSDAWTSSRKPLVGEFRFRGNDVFVIGNHFDSKLGDQNADGRFQYPTQSSRVQRALQATEVHDFVASLLKVDRKAKVIVAGDLNDYQFSPALATLTGATTSAGGAAKPILTDLITTLPADEQYTYVFDGISQVLDHILVTAGVGATQYQVVHVNSEFSDQVSDHDPQVVRAKMAAVPSLPVCTPDALAVNYSDSLNKAVYQGVKLGGLSSLAYDKRAGSWISAVDNNGTDPSRIWFIGSPLRPTVTRAPLVLKRADGTPYDGTTADDEGLAVLPNGDYLVSSETEPSIRIFGRDGIQKSSLPVPARFAVAPAGEATANATLEGLTIAPDGKTIVAAMEGALAGDVSATDSTAHRMLVYTQDRRGVWALSRQLAYRTDAGMRIPEVVAYRNGSLLVEEASFTPITGNAVKLYAVSGLGRAQDVTGVANLSTTPAASFLTKKLVADLVTCPTLGATPLESQANPLLDNFEGMAITGSVLNGYGISLISDDNFSAGQRTRVLNLVARLP